MCKLKQKVLSKMVVGSHGVSALFLESVKLYPTSWFHSESAKAYLTGWFQKREPIANS